MSSSVLWVFTNSHFAPVLFKSPKLRGLWMQLVISFCEVVPPPPPQTHTHTFLTTECWRYLISPTHIVCQIDCLHCKLVPPITSVVLKKPMLCWTLTLEITRVSASVALVCQSSRWLRWHLEQTCYLTIWRPFRNIAVRDTVQGLKYQVAWLFISVGDQSQASVMTSSITAKAWGRRPRRHTVTPWRPCQTVRGRK